MIRSNMLLALIFLFSGLNNAGQNNRFVEVYTTFLAKNAGRTDKPCHDTMKLIAESNGKAIFIRTDVSREDE